MTSEKVIWRAKEATRRVEMGMIRVDEGMRRA